MRRTNRDSLTYNSSCFDVSGFSPLALLLCPSASPFSVSFSLLRGEKATGLLRAHFPITHAQLVGEVGILPLNTAVPPLLRGKDWGFGIPVSLGHGSL